MSALTQYYRLAKPGIVYGNVLTTVAAFLYASAWSFPPLLLGATVFGMMGVIGSAAVFNNWLDRDLDAKMERTRTRALVTGAISVPAALAYGTALGTIGTAALWFYVNPLTAAVAGFGWFTYVVVYGAAKRTTHWGALIGSVPGSIPIVAGYTAVAGHVDIAAGILFVAMALWQLPHFYAIAVYRGEEYRAAGVPVLSLAKGNRAAKRHTVAIIALYCAAVSLFAGLGYAGYVYLLLVLVSGGLWLRKAVAGFRAHDDIAWAKGLFGFSLIVLLTFSLALALAPLLP